MFHREQILFAASMLLSRLINRFKDARSFRYRRALFIKLDEIGDVATAMHSWQLFKQQNPRCEITVWCKPFIRSLIENDPAIDRIVHERKQLGRDYDLVADLRGNWYAIWHCLIHPPQYRVDRATVRYRHRGRQQKEINTNFEIMQPVLAENTELQLPVIHSSAYNDERASEFLDTNKLQRFALMHPGARKLLRRWPAHQFAALADHLKIQHGLDTVFSGGPEDELLISEIMQQCKSNTYAFVNGYSLADFAALAKRAAIFIGNESGPMHIAAACKTPLIGLFGPGVPVVFYPHTSNSRVLHVVLECNPCDQVHCVYPDSPCITRIGLIEVSKAAEELLTID